MCCNFKLIRVEYKECKEVIEIELIRDSYCLVSFFFFVVAFCDYALSSFFHFVLLYFTFFELYYFFFVINIYIGKYLYISTVSQWIKNYETDSTVCIVNISEVKI